MLFWITVVVSIFLFLGFFGRHWWVFDLFVNFQLQYCIFFATVGAWFLFHDHWGEAAYAGVFALLTGLLVFSVYRDTPNALHFRGARLARILSFNIWNHNKDFHRLTAYTLSHGVDVLVVAEISEDIFRQMSLLLKKYEVQVFIPGANVYSNMAFFSRLPVRAVETIHLHGNERPSVRAELNVKEKHVVLYGVHPMTPFYAEYQPSLLELAHRLGQETDPVIVIGDLNTTPWSRHFRRLLRIGKLRDSRKGFGLGLSFPRYLPAIFRLPIDHALVSSEIKVKYRLISPSLGSDHLPILLDILI